MKNLESLITEEVSEQSTRFICKDCGRWTYSGKIQHSSRCDHYKTDFANISFPVKKEESTQFGTKDIEVAKAAREGNARSKYSDDDIFDACERGYLSVSSAMNQDM